MSGLRASRWISGAELAGVFALAGLAMLRRGVIAPVVFFRCLGCQRLRAAAEVPAGSRFCRRCVARRVN